MKLTLVSEIDYLRGMNHDSRELFVHWARESGKLGLVRCSSGNLSHRVNDDSILISGTGCWLQDLNVNEVAHMAIGREDVYNEVKPSAEHRLHRAIYSKRADVDTILHFQSPSATAIACMNIEPDYSVIIEVPVYIGKTGHLPFLMPGSDNLAAAVGAMMTDVNLLQLVNHGQVVCGKGYRETLQRAVFFELACTILLKSQFKAIPISQDAQTILQEYITKKM